MDHLKLYYTDQTDWGLSDFYALWRYLDRMLQFIGPSQRLSDALEHRDRLSATDRSRVERASALQDRITGRRDAELASLDLSRMSETTRSLMKHMLIQSGRYELALGRFPNLNTLDEVEARGFGLPTRLEM